MPASIQTATWFSEKCSCNIWVLPSKIRKRCLRIPNMLFLSTYKVRQAEPVGRWCLGAVEVRGIVVLQRYSLPHANAKCNNWDGSCLDQLLAYGTGANFPGIVTDNHCTLFCSGHPLKDQEATEKCSIKPKVKVFICVLLKCSQKLFNSVLVLLTDWNIAILHLHDSSNLRSVVVPTLWVLWSFLLENCRPQWGLQVFVIFLVKMY